MRPRAALGRLGAASLACALALAGISACAGGGSQPTATRTAVKTDPKEPPPPLPDTWPLTGEFGEVVERAALSVKIENTAPARPQTGLEQADVIWEEMIEGGESRFIAVYNSIVPERVGPVRSVRPMDGPILGATHGLLACSGGQDRFIAKAREAGLQVFTEDFKGYFRSEDRRMPYNLYLRPAEIWAQADVSHQALPLGEFVFAPSDAAVTAQVEGTPADGLDVAISTTARPGWTFQKESGLYLRSERGTPSMAASGTRLSASNVIALEVAVEFAGGTDSAGSPIPDTQIVGSGKGIVAAGGKAVEVEWSKKDVSSPIVLRPAAGGDVRLAIGQTWVELVPAGEGSWTVLAPEPSPDPED
ncbi:MAG: DUF3048 domain-containing protein [Bifidobacteriaceae bacterium]|jgi:hypothetical protein|nr:DUF3048 domain-containing protein [Bifidobacteriaceae bacterium]